MKLDLSRFRDIFFEEAAELLAELEAGLLALERQAGDAETLNSVFRAAHSIKGSAGMLDMGALMAFTHAMESLLDLMRAGQVPADPPRLALLMRAADVLRDLVRQERDGGEGPAGVAALLDELASGCGVAGGVASVAAPEAESPTNTNAVSRWLVSVPPDPGALRRGMDPLLLLRELDRLGRILATEADLTALPSLAALDPLDQHLAWEVELECRAGVDRGVIEELLEWFGVEGGLRPAPVVQAESPSVANVAQVAEVVAPAATARARAPRQPTVRMAVDKIDQLVTLAGELAVAHSMASEVAGNFRPERWPELELALADIGRQVWLLQQSVMSVRMLPASELFGRLPRLVRELEGSTGKRLELELDGEDVEIDKSVAERLADPLVHLVRNAAGHGIEEPPQRASAGKPAIGRIAVRALHEAGDMVIEIADDGKGLDAARIRAKAVERGLIAPASQLSDQALYDLIFEPGFSTAETVTSVSGRGVGMDVARRNIEQMGGAISLASRPGRGTRIRIRLPLTLAILDGLLVSIAGGLYLIPMAAVLKSVEPGAINAVPGLSGVVLTDGHPMPIACAAALLGLPETSREGVRPLAVILEKDRNRAAVLVDELLGRQQVIVRSLEDHYRKVPGLLGASILGDGQVALILDPAWMVHRARSGAGRQEGSSG